jgi:low affinity Fe/Cu permease
MKEPGKFSKMAAAGAEKIRDFAKRAGRKAQDLSAQGVLRVEITQLGYQRDKLIARLGEEVYNSLVTLDHATVNRETQAIRGVLDEIAQVKAQIEAKEKECADIGEASAMESDRT